MKTYLFLLLLCLVTSKICNTLNAIRKVGEHYYTSCSCIESDTKLFSYEGDKCYCYTLAMIVECRAAPNCEFDPIKGCY